VDRAGDRGGVAADLGAVAVEECAAVDGVLDVAAGDVPQVGVLGDHAQGRGRASADEDRRVGALDGLGVAERPGEVVVGAVEVERFSSVHSRRITVHASARLATACAESWKGRPCASYSRRARGGSGREPTPMPKSSRPPETMSTVVAILASIAGGRKRLLVTITPSRSRRVCAARAESSVQPSKAGPSGSPPIGMRWSNSQACSISGTVSASARPAGGRGSRPAWGRS
jgi:hypothetical protein